MNCLICKNDLGNCHKNKVYCSNECRLVNTLKIHNKICGFCKNEFKGTKNQKYCSGSCSAKNRADHLTMLHKMRRKYPKIDGLSKGQIYRKFNKHKDLYYLQRDAMKRVIVVQYLGGECIRCKYNTDMRALQLDHIHGNGKEDRKRLGSRICRYYINNLEEAKKNLQVLCANCHAIKTYIMEEKTRGKYRNPERNEGYKEFNY